MAGKPSFADALKKSANEQSAAPEEGGEGSSTVNPSRRGAKHIGGYFPPEVGRQLRTLAAVEDTSNQKLLAEALDMLFQSRRLPMIASR